MASDTTSQASGRSVSDRVHSGDARAWIRYRGAWSCLHRNPAKQLNYPGLRPRETTHASLRHISHRSCGVSAKSPAVCIEHRQSSFSPAKKRGRIGARGRKATGASAGSPVGRGQTSGQPRHIRPTRRACGIRSCCVFAHDVFPRCAHSYQPGALLQSLYGRAQ
jgi:hypothetical protein